MPGAHLPDLHELPGNSKSLVVPGSAGVANRTYTSLYNVNNA
jgi:hypothetical protein